MAVIDRSIDHFNYCRRELLRTDLTPPQAAQLAQQRDGAADTYNAGILEVNKITQLRGWAFAVSGSYPLEGERPRRQPVTSAL